VNKQINEKRVYDIELTVVAPVIILVLPNLLEEGRCFARQKRVLSSDWIVADTKLEGIKVYLSYFVYFMICVHILKGITVYFYTSSDLVD